MSEAGGERAAGRRADEDRDDVVRGLSAEVFAGLSRRVKRELAAAAKITSFQKGEAVYRAGETSDTVIVVLGGELAVRSDGGLGDDDLLHVGEGEITGLEALVGLTRRGTARALSKTRVASLSAPLLRRTLARHGGEGALPKVEGRLLRAAIADLLGRVPLGEDMSRADRAELAATMVPRRVARGERFARAGDVPTSAVVVVEGLVEVRAAGGDDGPARALDESPGRTIAFLSRGDVVDDEAILAGHVRAHDLLANGDSLVAELPAREVRRLQLIAPRALARARRVDVGRTKDEPALPFATRHAFHDLYRLHVARSLLVIDLETCVGCGHCAYSCASLHGVARIVRRGDALTSRDGADRARTLLLPSSCQHCELPSCMPACPTGAIGRDASGEVSIREDLCTGCEACARACPWDNIQMGPREGKTTPIFLDGSGVARLAGQSASVAVKCDLCRGFEVSACVDGCPVDAIVRLSPEDTTAVPEAKAGEVPAVGATPAPTLLVPAPREAWPVVIAATIVAAGLAVWGEAARRSAHLGPARGLGLAGGWLAAALLAWLWGYALRKRLVRAFVRPGERRVGARGSVRLHTMAHLAVGVLLPGVVCLHGATFTTRSSGGVLSIALAVATLAGALAALLYALLPSRIAKLSPAARLLEDVPREQRLLEDRLFRELSGRSDLVKKLAERVLLPYQRALLGPLVLLATGRTRQAERAALAARIDARLQGRGRDRQDGLEALIRTVVEHRALRASTWLARALALALPLHVVPSAFVIALLLAHVVEAFAR